MYINNKHRIFFEMALSAAPVCCDESVIYIIKKAGFEFSFVVLLVHAFIESI